MDKQEKVVVIRDLYKAFGELEVLKGVDLDLYREENLVVLGRSGTGKSVLIKIMVGLLQQDSGSMEVLGKEISKLGVRELNEMRLKIGFSFQNSALYDSMTVRENMEFPLVRNIKNLTKKEINIRVEELLDAVGLPQTINQMPSELSGGQKKRIGVARAPARYPRTLSAFERVFLALPKLPLGSWRELLSPLRAFRGQPSQAPLPFFQPGLL